MERREDLRRPSGRPAVAASARSSAGRSQCPRTAPALASRIARIGIGSHCASSSSRRWRECEPDRIMLTARDWMWRTSRLEQRDVLARAPSLLLCRNARQPARHPTIRCSISCRPAIRRARRAGSQADRGHKARRGICRLPWVTEAAEKAWCGGYSGRRRQKSALVWTRRSLARSPTRHERAAPSRPSREARSRARSTAKAKSRSSSARSAWSCCISYECQPAVNAPIPVITLMGVAAIAHATLPSSAPSWPRT